MIVVINSQDSRCMTASSANPPPSDSKLRGNSSDASEFNQWFSRWECQNLIREKSFMISKDINVPNNEEDRRLESGMWTKFYQCIVMDVKRWKAVQNPAFATLSSRWLCPCHSFCQNESWSRQGAYHYPELSSWTRTKKEGILPETYCRTVYCACL